MQLIIDIGNTLIKYYVFDEKTIINSSSENHLNWAISLEKIKKNYPELKSVIISDVNGAILNQNSKSAPSFTFDSLFD